MSGERRSPTDRPVRQSLPTSKITNVTFRTIESLVLEDTHTSILVNSGLMEHSGWLPRGDSSCIESQRASENQRGEHSRTEKTERGSG